MVPKNASMSSEDEFIHGPLYPTENTTPNTSTRSLRSLMMRSDEAHTPHSSNQLHHPTHPTSSSQPKSGSRIMRRPPHITTSPGNRSTHFYHRPIHLSIHPSILSLNSIFGCTDKRSHISPRRRRRSGVPSLRFSGSWQRLIISSPLPETPHHLTQLTPTSLVQPLSVQSAEAKGWQPYSKGWWECPSHHTPTSTQPLAEEPKRTTFTPGG